MVVSLKVLEGKQQFQFPFHDTHQKKKKKGGLQPPTLYEPTALPKL